MCSVLLHCLLVWKLALCDCWGIEVKGTKKITFLVHFLWDIYKRTIFSFSCKNTCCLTYADFNVLFIDHVFLLCIFLLFNAVKILSNIAYRNTVFPFIMLLSQSAGPTGILIVFRDARRKYFPLKNSFVIVIFVGIFVSLWCEMQSLFFPKSNFEVPAVHYWLKCSKRVLSKAVGIFLRLEKHGNGFLGETWNHSVSQ